MADQIVFCSRFKIFKMKRINKNISGAVRKFAFWVANRTVGQPLLADIDYSAIFIEPSALEMAYAIFMNSLEIDNDGNVINQKEAEFRAAQYIRCYVDPSYKVVPEFQEWECTLY